MMHQPAAPGPLPRPRRRLGLAALAFLTLLATAASAFLLVSLGKRAASAIDRDGGTRVALTARSLDGSSPNRESMSQAEDIIGKRVSGAQISFSGDVLTVTVPGQNQALAENVGQVGRLNIRPVSLAMPAHPLMMPGRPRSGRASSLNSPDLAERIATEKKVRQTTSQIMAMMALQFEATRCDEPDPLADNDDPALPLVTCSADRRSVYSLGPAIIGGDHIREAKPRHDEHSGRYVVDLQFDSAAASRWSQYAATHVGKKVAYALDTRVINAANMGSSAHITGELSSDGARQLANMLNSGPLPVVFQASPPESVAPRADSRGLWQTRPPIGLVVTAIGLVAILLCLQVYLYRSNNPRGAGSRQFE